MRFWQPPERDIIDLSLTGWSASLYVLRILETFGFGQYRWPIPADNDRDHCTW